MWARQFGAHQRHQGRGHPHTVHVRSDRRTTGTRSLCTVLIRQLGEVGGKTTRSRLGRAAWLPYRWGAVCPPDRPRLPRQLRPGGESENTYPPVLGLSWVSLHQLGAASLPRVHAPDARVRRKSLGKRHLAPEVSKAVGAGAAGKTTPGRCKAEAGSPQPG